MNDQTDLYSLRDIVRLTGARARSIQLWADAEAIVAVQDTDRAGTGTHRRFRHDQVELAAILARLASMGVNIGGLRRCGKAFRARSKGQRKTSERTKEMIEVMEYARRGQGRNILVYIPSERLKDAMTWYHDDNAEGPIGIAPPGDFGVIIDLNSTLRGLS